MIRFFDQANYDVLSHRKVAFILIFAFTIPGILLLAIRPLNLSIEFTGGTMIVVQANDETVGTASIREALSSAGLPAAEIQTFGADDEFAIRARVGEDQTDEATQETRDAVEAALNASFGASAFEIILTEAVGPKVGGELRRQAVLAIVLSLGAIFLYVSMRYEWRFGLAAVTATLHDILATFAFLSYFRIEISLFVVASLLIVVGYSLNDTIVTFDRVRENLRKFKRSKLYEILNRSINETLPRTVLTSGTTLAASMALVLLGGEVLTGPLLVVTFGVAVGTFSSVFIASPLLLLIEQKWPGEDVRGARDIAKAPANVVNTPRNTA